MKVLVVGKGGREHALTWKIAQSRKVDGIWAAPGSAGLADLATCLPQYRADTPVSQAAVLEAELDRLCDFAVREGIDLTVVGPEDALAGGIVDRFEAAGLTIFGPTAAAARIESDKTFAKDLMAEAGVPTAAHRSFGDSAAAVDYIRRQGAPIVVKASGLAAGKGVIVARTEPEAIAAVRAIVDDRAFGPAGAQVVVEEFMAGQEASLFAVCDGEEFVTLVPAQDHKAIGDGDTGPNTGGMGACAPAPVMTAELVERVGRQVVAPVLAELRRRGTPYRGVLFVGLMLTEAGPRVVEFNCRFGDPEAQVVLPLLRSDLVDLCAAAARGRLREAGPVELDTERAAVCVVLAAAGYPGPYQTGEPIHGLDTVAGDGIYAFHSGTARRGDEWVTAGGRVLGLTAVGADIPAAVEAAYAAVGRVTFEGAYWRRDIARRALAAG